MVAARPGEGRRSRAWRVARRWAPALAAVLLVAVSFGAGAWVERGFPGALPLPAAPGGEFDQTKVQQASRVIETNYYDAGVAGSQLSQGSVQGMVDSLADPFSQYLTADQYRSLQDGFAGRHDGVIGIGVAFEQGTRWSPGSSRTRRPSGRASRTATSSSASTGRTRAG